MESQEAKAFQLLQLQKENEQKEVLRKKMKEFDKQRSEKKYGTDPSFVSSDYQESSSFKDTISEIKNAYEEEESTGKYSNNTETSTTEKKKGLKLGATKKTAKKEEITKEAEKS